MPTYEYECKECSHNFEVYQLINDDPVKECPKCGEAVRRLISGGGGVIFKGSGFYVTDKGRKSVGPTVSSKDKDGKKPEETGAGDGVKSGAESDAKKDTKTDSTGAAPKETVSTGDAVSSRDAVSARDAGSARDATSSGTEGAKEGKEKKTAAEGGPPIAETKKHISESESAKRTA